MTKQSSIEWLIQCMSIHLTHEQKMQFEGLFQQAHDMHKQEIEDAFFGGINDTGEGRNGEYANGNNPNVETVFRKEYEQYYNKTYGGNNE